MRTFYSLKTCSVMKKSKILWLSGMAAMLISCSKDDIGVRRSRGTMDPDGKPSVTTSNNAQRVSSNLPPRTVQAVKPNGRGPLIDPDGTR
jgi:hypothetical protein